MSEGYRGTYVVWVELLVLEVGVRMVFIKEPLKYAGSKLIDEQEMFVCGLGSLGSGVNGSRIRFRAYTPTYDNSFVEVVEGICSIMSLMIV